MDLVVLGCGRDDNEIVRIGLESEKLELDGSNEAHNDFLARLINEGMEKAGHGNWGITSELVALMLRSKKTAIIITLPNLCSAD